MATQTPNLQLPIPFNSWAFRDMDIRRFIVDFVCLFWLHRVSVAACGPSLVVVRGLLTVVAGLVVEH